MFHYVTENGSIEMQIEDVECLGRRFSDVYDVGPRKDITVLGKGGFSSVIVGKHKDTNVEFAVKITNTSKMKPKSAARLRSEFEIQRILSHKNIVKTYNYFDEPPTNFIVMEYVRGGELFSRIVKKTFYSECDARKVGHILLSAVAHMHAHKIAHRDLKPENILLLNEDDDTSIKIADFGFAKKVLKPKSLVSSCGTLSYMAPELICRKSYDERADIWSIGVILYILMGGYCPFDDSQPNEQLAREIVSGRVEFQDEYWGTVSNQAKSLILSMLTVDMDNRPSAKYALLQPWIAKLSDEHLSNRDLSGNLDKLKSFNARKKLKGAMNGVYFLVSSPGYVKK